MSPSVIPKQNPLDVSTPGRIPIRLKSAIRTQYLVNGLTGVALYKLFPELTADQIANMLSREGWRGERKQLSKESESLIHARAKAAANEISEALASESEELCFKALTVTRDGLNVGGLNGAKQAQAASGALRNLHQIAQSIRQPGMEQPAGASSLNIFVMRLPSVPEKQAEVVDVESVVTV